MPKQAGRVLIVGSPFAGAATILGAPVARHWRAAQVVSLARARVHLGLVRFEVVLASEMLPDGLGYELAEAVSRQDGNLYAGIDFSESMLWLPVVEQGRFVLGARGLSSPELLSKMDCLLRARPNGTGRQAVTTRPGLRGPAATKARGGAARATRRR